MWFGVIGGLVLIWLLAVCFGLLPPPHASTLIRIRGGVLQIRKGQLILHARGRVGDLLREASVADGFIAVTPGNRVAFSRNIPAAIRQQLRNVILNQ
jgi:hypothetical protein